MDSPKNNVTPSTNLDADYGGRYHYLYFFLVLLFMLFMLKTSEEQTGERSIPPEYENIHWQNDLLGDTPVHPDVLK